MERNGKAHEVDIVFNISKLKFYVTLFMATLAIVGSMAGTLWKVNTAFEDLEQVKAKVMMLEAWARVHEDANAGFREEVIRTLDNYEVNQKILFKKLGVEYIERSTNFDFKKFQHPKQEEEN